MVCAQGQAPLLSGCRQDHFSGHQLLINLSERAIVSSIVEFLRVGAVEPGSPGHESGTLCLMTLGFCCVSTGPYPITVAYILTPLLWALSILTL